MFQKASYKANKSIAKYCLTVSSTKTRAQVNGSRPHYSKISVLWKLWYKVNLGMTTELILYSKVKCQLHVLYWEGHKLNKKVYLFELQ